MDIHLSSTINNNQEVGGDRYSLSPPLLRFIRSLMLKLKNKSQKGL